jgi:hypothetical protein
MRMRLMAKWWGLFPGRGILNSLDAEQSPLGFKPI